MHAHPPVYTTPLATSSLYITLLTTSCWLDYHFITFLDLLSKDLIFTLPLCWIYSSLMLFMIFVLFRLASCLGGYTTFDPQLALGVKKFFESQIFFGWKIFLTTHRTIETLEIQNHTKNFEAHNFSTIGPIFTKPVLTEKTSIPAFEKHRSHTNRSDVRRTIIATKLCFNSWIICNYLKKGL